MRKFGKMARDRKQMGELWRLGVVVAVLIMAAMGWGGHTGAVF